MPSSEKNDTGTRRQVIGTIVHRRSLGRSLAFADIRQDEGGDILQVVFRRESSGWDRSRDGTFPGKKSLLPYGARVRLLLVGATIDSTDGDGPPDGRADGTDPPSEVRSWEVLTRPSELARASASIGAEGVSCSAYLRSRGAARSSARRRPERSENGEEEVRRGDSTPPARNADADADAVGPERDSPPHVDTKAKALRANVFAGWLIGKFGADALRRGGGVLDIAGGKGRLSVELGVAAAIPCTVVDPLVRRRSARSPGFVGLAAKDKKRLRKSGAPRPSHLAVPFGDGFLAKPERADLVRDAACLVGLHPDECTADILDAALRFDKSVAIVPCCVFPTLFPDRRLRDSPNTPVTSYDDFLKYLLEKDDRLERESLPFHGPNHVIYLINGKGK